MSTTSVTVRINDDLLSWLKSRAGAENRTLSNMINSILSDSFRSPSIHLDDVERSFAVVGAFLSAHANDDNTRQMYWDFATIRLKCYPIIYPKLQTEEVTDDD